MCSKCAAGLVGDTVVRAAQNWTTPLADFGFFGLYHAPMPPSIPQGLNRDHVLKALADLDVGIEHPFGNQGCSCGAKTVKLPLVGRGTGIFLVQGGRVTAIVNGGTHLRGKDLP